eukprot:4069315-Pyramimonas_sp.AAC.1
MRVRAQLLSAKCWLNKKGILQYYRLFTTCHDLPFPPESLLQACAAARGAIPDAASASPPGG